MIEKFYYIRDKENKPRITVCFLKDESTGDFARGVAICSKRDNPCKRTGRNIARGRAIWALKNMGSNCLVKRREATFSYGNPFIMKAAYLPPLLPIEERLIQNNGKTIKEMAV